RYDYTKHVLYVWRRDGNPPGPQYPIEAPLISTNLPNWGDAGPWVSYPGYVRLRGLVLRFCNASADAFYLYGKAYPAVAALGGHCADFTVAGNVFSNNWGVAIHCDTVSTPPDHPVRILGNFILSTNSLPDYIGGGGIDMEVASSAWIINNVIVTSAHPAISMS